MCWQREQLQNQGRMLEILCSRRYISWLFQTKLDFLVSCLKGDPWPDRYAVSRIASCHTDKDCPQNYTCIQRGNRKICCPSSDYVCGNPYDARNSCRRRRDEIRNTWTFNYKKGQCTQVTAPSCSEQLNSFPSLETCSDYCIGTCPDGSEVHINPFTDQPQMCNSKTKSGCPLGYECIKRSKYSSICCKTSPTCPAPESVLLTSMGTGEAVRCVLDIDKSCPEGYTCQRAPNNVRKSFNSTVILQYLGICLLYSCFRVSFWVESSQTRV